MFLLRRAALRATSSIAAPGSRPRTFTSLSVTPSAFRPRQQQWLSAAQRRFNSDDSAVARPSEEKTTDETVEETTGSSADAEDQSTLASAFDSAAETTGDAFNAAATAVGGAAAQAVGRAQGEDRRQFVPTDQGKKTLYVGNLFFQTTEDQVRQEFSKYGNIQKTTIIRDPAGLSRGFGYVEFETDEEAAAAIVQMNQRILDGRRLTVQHHRRREEADRPQRPRRNEGAVNTPSKTLFIGNMSFEMSDRDLNDLFREIRNVLDVRVAIDRRTGQPRGFAHADFIDETSATKAKEVLENKEIYGRRLRVDYSRSSQRS